jgi:ABC-type siderophore export system fused ATPase/permease subunit
VALGYLLYYFGLTYLLNVGGRKIAQTKMINITNNIALDLRINLINKLFSTRYHRFEKIQNGRIFTTLSGDTAALAGMARLSVGFVTNLITLISGFIYMTTISVTSTLVVIAVVIGLVLYYRIAAKISRGYMEEARDTQNVHMSLLNGLTQGYRFA